MSKFQEYFFRVLLAAIFGATIGFVVAFVILEVTGVHGSTRYEVGIDILTAIVFFFIPYVKDSAKKWVKENADMEAYRKAQGKQHAEWVKQERERHTAKS